MRFLSSLLALCVSTGLVAASLNQAPDVSVTNAFFPSHAHMLIHPSTHPSHSHSDVHVSISAPNLSPSTTSTKTLVSSVELNDVQHRLLGLLPTTSHTSLNIKPTLELPHASIQLSVQGDTTLSHALSSNDATHMKLKDISYGADSIAVATTLSTGKQPSETGIIARKWSHSTAFSSASTASHVATTADVIAQSFDGQSLILSISADEQMSMANCVHPTLASTNYARWNFFCVSLDDKGFHPRTFPSTSQIAMTKTKSALSTQLTTTSATLLSQLTTASSNVLSALPSSIAVSYTTDAIIIDGISFSLSKQVDTLLLRELQYIDHIIQVLKDSELVQDGVPDQIAINIGALQTLRTEYGVSSPQYRVALKLVQYCVPKLMSRLSELYDDSVIRTTILYGDEPVMDQSVLSHLSQNLIKQLSQPITLPFLSLIQTSNAISICNEANKALTTYGYNVYCPQVHGLQQQHFRTYADPVPTPAAGVGCNATSANCTAFTAYQVQKYQILLWFSIILILITLSAIFALCGMKFKKDTMLYSSFNPNWEDRKRR